MSTASKTADKSANMLREYVSVLSTAGRAAIEGTIEVDKLILTKLADGARDTMNYGRELMAVRDVNTAVSSYANFASTRLNKSVADTKEVLDLAKARAEDVIKPFKAVA